MGRLNMIYVPNDELVTASVASLTSAHDALAELCDRYFPLENARFKDYEYDAQREMVNLCQNAFGDMANEGVSTEINSKERLGELVVQAYANALNREVTGSSLQTQFGIKVRTDLYLEDGRDTRTSVVIPDLNDKTASWAIPSPPNAEYVDEKLHKAYDGKFVMKYGEDILPAYESRATAIKDLIAQCENTAIATMRMSTEYFGDDFTNTPQKIKSMFARELEKVVVSDSIVQTYDPDIAYKQARDMLQTQLQAIAGYTEMAQDLDLGFSVVSVRNDTEHLYGQAAIRQGYSEYSIMHSEDTPYLYLADRVADKLLEGIRQTEPLADKYKDGEIGAETFKMLARDDIAALDNRDLAEEIRITVKEINEDCYMYDKIGDMNLQHYIENANAVIRIDGMVNNDRTVLAPSLPSYMDMIKYNKSTDEYMWLEFEPNRDGGGNFKEVFVTPEQVETALRESEGDGMAFTASLLEQGSARTVSLENPASAELIYEIRHKDSSVDRNKDNVVFIGQFEDLRAKDADLDRFMDCMAEHNETLVEKQKANIDRD